MKTPERILDVTSTLEGERVGMTIDTSALSHIMSVLTDLYSDPELAILREYSTNAWDSHVEAGETRPIEVDTPTSLSPFLRIRDYGIGLDADGIRDIYSRYGTSTKRHTDDVVGMLGLGCKSALTYCDQFTLTAWKDGRMIQVAIGRDEDGAGSMMIVADADTDEPNGVEVSIPTKRSNNLTHKAQRFFSVWPEGQVLLNGEPPARIEGTPLGPNTIVIGADDAPTDTSGEHTIVMGNVPYPWPSNIDPPQVGKHRVTVTWVPIGSVMFTPSRESLQQTKMTNDFANTLRDNLHAIRDDELSKQIAAAATAAEAQSLMVEATQIGLPPERAEWKGRPVLLRLDRTPDPKNPYFHKADESENSFLIAWPEAVSYHGYRKTGERQWTLQLDRAENKSRYNYYRTQGSDLPRIIFTGFDGKTLTPTRRAKLDAWLTQQGDKYPSKAMWVFVKELAKDERFWLNGHHIVKWEPINELKLTNSDGTPKPKGSYRVAIYDPDEASFRRFQRVQADQLDKAAGIVYYHGNEYATTGHPAWRSGLMPKGMQVVAIEGGRIEKFKRDFPTAAEMGTWMREHLESEFKKVSKDALLRVRLEDIGHWQTLQQLGKYGVQLTDPELAATVALAATAHDKRLDKLVETARRYNLTTLIPELPDPFKQYPLMNQIGGRYMRGQADAEHLALYLNAAYAARKEGL